MSANTAYDYLKSKPIADTAGEYLRDSGITQMSKEGLGFKWQQDFVRSAMASKDFKTQEDNAGNQFMLNGMEDSGVFNDKLPAALAGDRLNTASSALGQAIGESDKVKTNAMGQIMNYNMGRDSMELQKDMQLSSLEASKVSGYQEFLKTVSALSGFLPLIPGGSGKATT